MTYARPAAGFCVAAALFTCGATGFPDAPATLPPSSGQLVLGSNATTTLAPGATVQVSGDGFASMAAVTVAVYSTPSTLGHVVADSTGHVDATVQLPNDLTGTHTLTAVGNAPDNSGRAIEAQVQITSAGTAITDGAQLAYTGFDATAWALGALGMLVTGFILIRTTVFRRRFLPVTR